MKNSKLQPIVEGGVLIALATVLSYVKVFEMPQGGSVTAGSMLPIILYSCRWGVKKGLLVAFIYGVMQFLLSGGFSIQLLSILLDYVLPFGMLGIAGIFGNGRIKAVLGATFAIFLRFAILVFSGVVLWGSYAPAGMYPLRYSIGYNASYMLPEGILTVVFLLVLYEKVMKMTKRV